MWHLPVRNVLMWYLKKMSGTFLINTDGGPIGLVNSSGIGSAGGVAGASAGTAASAVSPVAVVEGRVLHAASLLSPLEYRSAIERVANPQKVGLLLEQEVATDTEEKK